MGKALTKVDDNEFFAGRYGPYYSTRSTDSGEHTNSIPLIAIGTTQGTKLGSLVSFRRFDQMIWITPGFG
jgi:hypothetical protein